MKSIDGNEKLERTLIEGIQDGDEDAFKEVFLQYFKPLCSISAGYLNSYDLAREVVQDVFLSIWENHEVWNPSGPLKPYLYRAVYNRSLNYIKKDQRHQEVMKLYSDSSEDTEDAMEEEDQKHKLSNIIWEKVKQLPKKRYLVFVLHRQQGLSYKEIAEYMNISVKTVENQMGQALKFLKNELSKEDYP